MGELGKVKSLLETLAYGEKSCKCLNGAVRGRGPFVTISRQAGAGGNSLAKEILRQLREREGPLLSGWQSFNQELCKKITEEPGLNVSLKSLLDSEYHSEIEDMLEEIVTGSSPQDAVNKKIFELMRTLAVFGKAILVGRGGVCLTRDLPLGVHVRLVAPLEVRVKRMGGLLGLNPKKACELVKTQDRARAKFVKRYFDRDIEDALLYDAVWNTGTTPIDQIAKAVVGMIESKACLCMQEEGRFLVKRG